MEKLKELRADRVLSLADLSRLSGVDRQTIWRIQAGRHGAHQKTIRKLAKALGVEPRELLKGEE